MDKWVPHELNENHTRKRYETSSALLLRNQNYPLLSRNGIYNKKWVLYDNRKGSVH